MRLDPFPNLKIHSFPSGMRRKRDRSWCHLLLILLTFQVAKETGLLQCDSRVLICKYKTKFQVRECQTVNSIRRCCLSQSASAEGGVAQRFTPSAALSTPGVTWIGWCHGVLSAAMVRLQQLVLIWGELSLPDASGVLLRSGRSAVVAGATGEA